MNPERELDDLCAVLTRRRLLESGGGDGQDMLERMVKMKSKQRDGG